MHRLKSLLPALLATFALSASPVLAACGAAPGAATDGALRLVGAANTWTTIGGLGTAAAGDVAYDTTNNALSVCNGTAWTALGAGAASQWLNGASSAIYYSAGNVGIGTATPSVTLDIYGSLNLRDGYNLTWGGAYAAGIPTISGTTSDHSIRFYPSGATGGELVRINSSGNVGIGTISPGQKLSVAGTIESTSGGIKFPDGTTQTTAAAGSSIPTGAVMAFDLTACPTGWSEYTAARGRFLRGIDNGAGNDPSGTRAPGNTQTDDLKSHNHSLDEWSGVAAVQGDGAGRRNPASTTLGGTQTGMTATSQFAYGGSETRPKNVAVLFCRKD